MSKNNQKSSTKPDKDKIRTQLITWGHEGTKESIKKLENFIKNEQDEDLKGFAEIALEETSYYYYDPKNDMEEEDFILLKMIEQKKNELFDLGVKIEQEEFRVKKHELDNKICKKLSKNKKWEDKYCEYILSWASERAEELKEEIDFNYAWISTATNMIRTERYHTIPLEILNSIHLDCETADEIYADEDECRCCKRCRCDYC